MIVERLVRWGCVQTEHCDGGAARLFSVSMHMKRNDWAEKRGTRIGEGTPQASICKHIHK